MKLHYLFLLIMLSLMSCERTGPTIRGEMLGVDNCGYRIYRLVINEHDYIKYRGNIVAHSEGTCRKCRQERDSITNLIIQKLNHK